MRVLHVLDISIPMLAGYTSRSRYIVNNQKALGIEPVVLSSPRQKNEDRVSMEVLDGISYYRTVPKESMLSAALDKPGAREAMEINALRRRVVEVAQRENVDIIHAHSSILCGIPGMLAARELGLPCVYEIRSFWEDAAVDNKTAVEGDLRYRATQGTETWLAQRVDALVAICEGIKTEMVGRGLKEENVHVVPNGVEVDKFVAEPRDKELEERYGFAGKTVVGYIGTFAQFEGVPYLVKALIQLMQSGRDDLAGLIVGKGPTYKICQQLAKDAGLEDRIVHPGRVSHDEVRRTYSQLDILAYPRDRQRITEMVTPLKPLEAMAMEKAVMGSNVGGLTELIHHEENGLVFEAENVDSLAQGIQRLVDDPTLRADLGRRGRAYVKAERSWRNIIERHFALYETAQRNWQDNRRLYQGVAKLASPLRRLGL